jgi:hypothetical protein
MKGVCSSLFYLQWICDAQADMAKTTNHWGGVNFQPQAESCSTDTNCRNRNMDNVGASAMTVILLT